MRKKRRAAHLCFRLASIALLPMGGACRSDVLEPGPQAVELRVGGGLRAYVAGTATVEGRTVELQAVGNGLRASLHVAQPGRRVIELRLRSAGVIGDSGTTLTHFDTFAPAVTLTPGIVEIDLATLEPTASDISLARSEFTALLPDDPCRLVTVVDRPVPHLDADRALYRGSFQDLVALTFADRDGYEGGDLFDDGQDRSAFLTTCASDAWDRADTVICAVVRNEIVCVMHSWERT